MQHNQELFKKFDLLLPGKFDGGYLVIALYLKIMSKELDRYFTTSDIKRVLAELAEKFGETRSQADRIINQLRFFIYEMYLTTLFNTVELDRIDQLVRKND